MILEAVPSQLSSIRGRHRIRFAVTLFVLVLSASQTLPQVAPDSSRNPYEIMRRSLKAIGASQKIGPDETEGVVYMKGTIHDEEWDAPRALYRWVGSGIRFRQVVESPEVILVSGDNGEYGWTYSAGVTEIMRDEEFLTCRKIQELLSQNMYLDSNSSIFKLTFVGVEDVAEAGCYVLMMTNSLNTDTVLTFIDTLTYYHRKSIKRSKGVAHHSTYSDFRRVEGWCVYAFRAEVAFYPEGGRWTEELEVVEMQTRIDPINFEPPLSIEDFR